MREQLDERILEQVAACAARVDALGWGEATAGNLSLLLTQADLRGPFRPAGPPLRFASREPGTLLQGAFHPDEDWPDDRYLLISATGSRMRELAGDPASGLCLIGKTGGGLYASRDSRAASSELPAHLAVLRDRAPGSALMHGHPEFLIALSHVRALQGEGALERALLPLMPETVMFLGRGIKRLPFDLPGGLVLAARSAVALQGADILVWDRHGALAVGADAPEALDRLELAEKAARVWWLAQQTGEPPMGMPAGIFQSLRERFGAVNREGGDR
jgi:rhamnulose-1-phosphate aldolase